MWWKQATDRWIRLPARGVTGQAFRYVVSGGIAFGADFAVLGLLTECVGLHYLASSVLGFSCGLTVTYLLSVCWVFDQRRFDSRLPEVALFVLIGVVGLGITAVCMWLFTDVAEIHYLLSKIATTFVSTAWNFLAKKYLLFSRKGAR